MKPILLFQKIPTQELLQEYNNEVSEEIPILGGVRQGDPISPKLFTATVQEVFKMPS